MPLPTYDERSYRNSVRMSQRKHVLVEGKHDKIAFAALFHALRKAGTPIPSIDIDRADTLDCPGVAGMRDRVEAVSGSIVGTDYADRFVGFADREYREFEWTVMLRDRLGRHNVIGRLVWSRGHSMENYFLDPEVLLEVLALLAGEHPRSDSADLHGMLQQAIREACALGLAAAEQQVLSRVADSIRPTSLALTPSTVAVDTKKWKAELVARRGLTRGVANRLVKRFEALGKVVAAADPSLVRWLSHGHLTMGFIWAALQRYLSDSSAAHADDQRSAAGRMVQASDELRLRACAQEWARKAASDECDYPREILVLLGAEDAEGRPL